MHGNEGESACWGVGRGAERKPPEDLSLDEWLSLVACFFMPPGKLGQAGLAI